MPKRSPSDVEGPRPRLIRIAATIAIATVVAAFMPQPAFAAGRGFNPGHIISDDSFFNGQAMSERQIQTFLDARKCVPQDDVPCLADYRETTTTQPTQFDHCDR
jgi:hypothetical protein